MQKVFLYHNPKCSKSRQTLSLLEQMGIEPTVIRYLETPPTKTQLKTILTKLSLPPRELIRKGEKEYETYGFADESLSDDQLITMMIKHPKVIERPIVVANGKAKVGRPPESVLDIL